MTGAHLTYYWSRSRRDCGNLEAAIPICHIQIKLLAAVAATAAILRRPASISGQRFWIRPQSPRLRQS